MGKVKLQGTDGREIDFARGRLGEAIDLVGYQKKGRSFEEGALEEVHQYVLNEWKSLAQARLGKKAQVYTDGLVVNDSGNPAKVSWGLRGFEAISLELGWAPPPGRNKHKSDGIGEWDGAVHDMRSYMLTAGNPGLKISKTDGAGGGPGTRYMLVPFKENEMAGAVAQAGLAENTGRKQSKKWRGKTQADLDAAFKNFQSELENLAPGQQLRGGSTDSLPIWERQIRSRKGTDKFPRKGGAVVAPAPTSEKDYARLTAKHKYSKYHNIIRNQPDVASGSVIRRRGGKETELNTKGKARGKYAHRFTMIRTITDDLADRSWHTVGYPPANLIKEMRSVIARAVSNVMAGRPPGALK